MDIAENAEKSDRELRRAKRNHLIERVVTAAVGAVLLALQGVNINETGTNGDLIRRIEEGLRAQTQMIKQDEIEGSRVDRALENQSKMIEKLDGMLSNETKMLDLLRQQQEKH
jgi:hypothetical protein